MIRGIIFDLDNTLYSAKYGLERNMARRLLVFISEYLGLSLDDAAAARRQALAKYGSSLAWLVQEKGFTDIEGYFAALHPPGEEADLPPDPQLRVFLENLPVPFAILTNSPREHADRVLAKLGVADLAAQIFDIRQNNMVGKPNPSAFQQVLEALGSSPEETLFVDDYIPYVEGYVQIGGLGVLFDEDDEHPDAPYTRIRSLDEILSIIILESL